MTFLVVIIILALIFDYINGFHDAANSIATIVSTKVLTPFQAVLWAALFNFVAFFIANICKNANPYKADKWFRRLQLVSSALFSIGHGSNDSQKVMGIIGAAFIYYQKTKGVELTFNQFIDHNLWVPLSCYTVIALGT